MNDINELVICQEEYSSKEEFEQAIKDAVMLLLNANYIMIVKYDEKGLGIVSIDYVHKDNDDYGGIYPYFLTNEEYEFLCTENDNGLDICL